MRWHFLTDMTSQTAFCRHCGSKCGSFDTPERTYFFCRNVWWNNVKILYCDRQEDRWTIGEAKSEYVRLANEFFEAHGGLGLHP
jgi:hypothetical protein